MCARIQIPWYVAGRRVKVVPPWLPFGFHLDSPSGFGTFAFGISPTNTFSQQDSRGSWPSAQAAFLRQQIGGPQQSVT